VTEETTPDSVGLRPGVAAASSSAEWADFNKLWFGQSVSQLGTAITIVALPLVAVLQLHASAFEVGVIAGAQYVAYATLGFVAGVYVDRRKRRNVMLAADAGRAVALAVVPVLSVTGLLEIWHLYLVALVVGILTLLFDTAYQAYLPTIVSRDKLISGNSKLLGSTSAAQLAGPGVAGLLVAGIGAAKTLLTDAFSYIISFVSVLAIRARVETHITSETRRESVRSQIVEGFRYVREDRILVSVLASVAQFNILITAEEALFVVFLVRSVHASPAVVGLLLSAAGVGAILGAIFSQRIVRAIGTGRALVLGATIGPILGILIPFTYMNATLLFFVVGTAGLGASTTIVKVVGGSYRQAIVPPHLLGRVVATMRTITWGPLPLAGLLGGVLGQVLGPRMALLVLALLMVPTPLWLLRSPVWTMTDLDEAPT
jgi:MFS family permease